MKLQTRFLLLIVVVFVAVAGFLFVQRILDQTRSNKVLQTTLEERKKSFKIGLEAEGELFYTFVKDYSYWDDMVNFVKTGDKNFAQNNLDTGIGTYKVDNIWVYNTAGKQIYSKSSDNEHPINNIPLPADFFTKVSKDKFVHFYLQLPEGTYEVRASTIVPSDDPDHNKPASGYFVIGRFLGDDYTQKVGSLSQSEITLESADKASADQASGDTVQFLQPLKNLKDETIQLISAKSEVPVIKVLNSSYSQQLILFLIIGAAILIFILLGLYLFVLRPISVISISIKKKNPTMLNNMAKSHSQFGELAVVVREFFHQKVQIQEAETKREQLEKLNQEKTAFLSAAAHELKAPGTIISLVSESLAKDATKNKNVKELVSEVDTIAHQAKKMTGLVSDLRAAAEGKKSEQRPSTVFDFDTFLKQEVDELSYVIEQKLILSGSTKKKLETDELHLSQVVSNLIRNAAKYSKPNTVIHIKSSVKGGDIVVEFVDQGVGISKADQKHLFEKYFRAESVKTQVEGLGLGLSICHDIIVKMGGKLWVESEVGKGSHFFFSLPVSKLSPKSKK